MLGGPRRHSHSAGSFFFSSRRRHTRFDCDWSSDVCSSDLLEAVRAVHAACPDASILVDPNQAWSIELLNELAPELHALGVVLIEQPLPAGEIGRASCRERG